MAIFFYLHRARHPRSAVTSDKAGFAARADPITEKVIALASRHTRAASEKVVPDVKTSSTSTTFSPDTHPAHSRFAAMKARRSFRRSTAVANAGELE